MCNYRHTKLNDQNTSLIFNVFKGELALRKSLET